MVTSVVVCFGPDRQLVVASGSEESLVQLWSRANGLAALALDHGGGGGGCSEKRFGMHGP